MLKKELKELVDQWWEKLETNCLKQFKTCLDDIADGQDPDCCCICKDFCKNVIGSFEAWKDKKGRERQS